MVDKLLRLTKFDDGFVRRDRGGKVGVLILNHLRPIIIEIDGKGARKAIKADHLLRVRATVLIHGCRGWLIAI